MPSLAAAEIPSSGEPDSGIDVLRILVGASQSRARTLARALESTGSKFFIEQADNAEKVVAALNNGSFDCAVIDLKLPAFAGSGDLIDWRKRGLDTPVIVVLEDASGETILRLVEAGASDCLGWSDLGTERLVLTLHATIRTYRIETRLAAAERKLAQLSLRDPLTRLPGRTLFLDRLEQMILICQREQRQTGLLLIDINRFSDINQSFGHHTGDRLLEQISERARRVLRASDTLARIGDDQFAVIMATGGSRQGAITIAQKMHEALSTPFEISNRSLVIGVGIGIALYPTHGSVADQLLRAAVTATRRCKIDGTPYSFVPDDHDRTTAVPPSLIQEIRKAIDHQQFILHYQPMIEMDSRRVCGVEALVRWQHADRGLIQPDTFIPLAEQAGLIDAITMLAMEQALEQLHTWRSQGIELPLSVNLSAISLRNPRLVPNIEERLSRFAVPSGYVTLEITESAIISDASSAAETLRRLHQLGIGLAIDDFGTGYTSLAYLRKLPLSRLKIDKSFVQAMRDNGDDAIIVRTIIELGRNLGLQVVAEGVEDAETLDMLSTMGCAVAQGFFMSRPLAGASLVEWLHESPWGLGTAG